MSNNIYDIDVDDVDFDSLDVDSMVQQAMEAGDELTQAVDGLIEHLDSMNDVDFENGGD